MSTSPKHSKFARAVAAAIINIAIFAVLFFGVVASAHAAVDQLTAPRTCSSCGMVDPLPEPPGFPDLGSRIGLGGPDTSPPVRKLNPGGSVGIGNPNDRPSLSAFNPQPDPPSAGLA